MKEHEIKTVSLDPGKTIKFKAEPQAFDPLQLFGRKVAIDASM